jgi:hypothetical protein
MHARATVTAIRPWGRFFGTLRAFPTIPLQTLPIRSFCASAAAAAEQAASDAKGLRRGKSGEFDKDAVLGVHRGEIEEVRNQLLKHPVYDAVSTIPRLKVFMTHHCFAVWDFMSLLKRLQRDVTCVSIPWVPPPNPHHSRYINEIVLGEECDEDGKGGYTNHFDLYIGGMQQTGADTSTILSVVNDVRAGKDFVSSARRHKVPETAIEFVNTSLEAAVRGKTHEVCSMFLFGRENLIPAMFPVLRKNVQETKDRAERFTWYLNRHIDLDGDSHGPLAEKLLAHLVGSDPVRQEEAAAAAKKALRAREVLWNGVVADIKAKGL